MKGGAYGAFSSFDPYTGIFTLLSYRDPHIEETLKTFDASVQFLQEIKLSKDELTKAIIGAISDFDHYMLPDAKGFASLTRYLTGMTEAKRQQIREEILHTTEKDFHAFAKQLEKVAKHGIIAITTQLATVPLPDTFTVSKIS